MDTNMCDCSEECLTECKQKEWKEGELPPVGSVCEFDESSDNIGEWRQVVVIAHFDGKAVFHFPQRARNNKGLIDLYQNDSCFRPIKSERDRVIEEMESVVYAGGHLRSKELAEIIYDKFIAEKE